MVFTARYAAQHFGVDLSVIGELVEQMAPEDGCLSAVDSSDHDAGSNTAFTRRGLDYLYELLDQRRSDFMQEN